MNIIILTHYLPYPLSSGGAQAQFNMINELRHRHHITIIFSEGSGSTIRNMHILQSIWPDVDIFVYPICRQIFYRKYIYDKLRRYLQIIFTPESRRLKVERTLLPYGLWLSKDHIKFVIHIIEKKKADIIQVEFFQQLSWINYLPHNIHRVFVHHEICFVRNERFLKNFHLDAKEHLLLKCEKSKELSELNMYDKIITLTDNDKRILENNGVNIPISVSPAAINTTPLPYKEWLGKIVFVGGYNHIPNREGIDWFMSQVATHLPNNTKFDIVGTSWPTHYAEHQPIQICLRGFVEKLEDAAYGQIMIVPILTGSGMRMKILEAAAMSMPIITTTVGVEGLDFTDNESCIIADEPESFAQAIIKLSNDVALRKHIGCGARNVFDQKYAVQILAKRREQIYKQLLLCEKD